MLRICASFSLYCVRAQGTLATQLLVVNEKIKNFMLLNSVPTNFFDSFAPLVLNPKVYGDLALLGDRAQGNSQWFYPISEKGWQEIILYLF